MPVCGIVKTITPRCLRPLAIVHQVVHGTEHLGVIVYSYFMPVCSIVKTITPRCRGRPDALLHEANTFDEIPSSVP